MSVGRDLSFETLDEGEGLLRREEFHLPILCRAQRRDERVPNRRQQLLFRRTRKMTSSKPGRQALLHVADFVFGIRGDRYLACNRAAPLRERHIDPTQTIEDRFFNRDRVVGLDLPPIA